MKKISMALVFVVICFLLASPFLFVLKDVAFANMTTCIKEHIDKTMYQRLNDKEIKKYYGLSKHDYDSALVYKHHSAMEAEEIAIFYVEDEDHRHVVLQALKRRKDDKLLRFKGYAQPQYDRCKQGIILEKKQYIMLIIDENQDALMDDINALF